MKILFAILFFVFIFSLSSLSHANTIENCKTQLLDKHYKRAIKSCENSILNKHKSGYFYLGKVYLNLDQPLTAIDFFKKFKHYSTKEYAIGKVDRYIAISYLNLYLNNKFLYYKDNFITLSLCEGYQTNLYMLMNNLSALNLINKLFKKAIMYFHQSLKFSNRTYYAKIFNDLAYLYFFNRNFNKAVSFEKKAIKYAQENSNLHNLPLYLLNLSYFKLVKNRNNTTSKNWQESYFNFLTNVKKFALIVSKQHTQIGKIIDNTINAN